MKEFRYSFRIMKIKQKDLKGNDITGIQILALDQLGLDENDNFTVGFQCEHNETTDKIINHMNACLFELLMLISENGKVECVDMIEHANKLMERMETNEKESNV